MTTLLLSAGRAQRMGGGCKAAVNVGGKTMYEWWQAVDPNVTIVARSEHFPALGGVEELITCDTLGGAAVALQTALPFCDGPLTVAFADTWVPAESMPKGVDWCGVAAAGGGRSWDVVEDGLAAYRHVEAGEVVVACIGLYRFSDLERLNDAVIKAVAIGEFFEQEAGMADVVNHYGLSFRPVLGWQDVGDEHALAAWRPL